MCINLLIQIDIWLSKSAIYTGPIRTQEVSVDGEVEVGS